MQEYQCRFLTDRRGVWEVDEFVSDSNAAAITVAQNKLASRPDTNLVELWSGTQLLLTAYWPA